MLKINGAHMERMKALTIPLPLLTKYFSPVFYLDIEYNRSPILQEQTVRP